MVLRHLTAAALILAAALTAAAPSEASAAVLEGSHAASVSAEEGYGPGTQDIFWKKMLVERLGLRSAECPAGLEEDLWEETLRSLGSFAAAAQTNLEEVNALRVSASLPALTIDPELSAAAAYRAAQIRKYQHFSHYGPAGEFLAYTAARAITGSEEIYVYENYYYELNEVLQMPPVSETAGSRRTSGAGQEAMSPEMEEELKSFARSGQAWFCGSPVHYENLVRSGICRIGIGFSVSTDEEPVADIMVQIFE